VWVFVDYNTGSKMERLPVTGATVTEGSTKIEDGNDKGAWVIANNSENFSAMVTLSYSTIEVGTVSGACVYASGYPPVADYETPQTINFTGTPPYDLVLKHSVSGGTITRQTGSVYDVLSGYILERFTDKTGAPGKVSCIPMSGTLAFRAPDVSKAQLAIITVSQEPETPPAGEITYSWSAPGFDPATGTDPSFQTRAPAEAGDYEVTLTAHAGGYCDLPVTQTVPVVNCGPGRLGTGADLCPGQDGGRIGSNEQ
jgi:hypothetical protein